MKTFKQHILEKLKVSSSSVYNDVEEKISNRRSKTNVQNRFNLIPQNKTKFRDWVDDMIVADDFVTVEPLDCLISFVPISERIFWNYNRRKDATPETIEGVVLDGSMTWGEAYDAILRFIHDKYEDKDVILPKLELFAKYKYKGKNPDHNAIVYTLVNFDTTLKQDLERIYTLRELGYWAYVMIYNKEHCDPIYKKLQSRILSNDLC